MTAAGRGILAIWQDIAVEAEEMVQEWYNREHHVERLSVPGFLRARRFLATTGSPRVFVYYETESPAVLTSPEYMERLNTPTEWTRRVMPHFRNYSRTVCRVAAKFGAGFGGAVATVRLRPAPGRTDELAAWITTAALPAVQERPGVTDSQFWRADHEASAIPTAERDLRSDQDTIAEWILVVGGNTPEQIDKACADVLADDMLVACGARGEAERGLYHLIFALVA
jgi:hypothetical protein